MNRDRLSKQPVGKPLTFSEYIGMVFEEPIILHSTAQRLNFSHWAEHLNSFFGYVSNKPPKYNYEGKFNLLVDEISKGLRLAGFISQSERIIKAKTEEELNKVIIRQYTEETGLYHSVNELLRMCHIFQLETEDNSGFLEKYETPFAPWILQLNTAIRREPYYEKKYTEEQLFHKMIY